MYGKSVAVTCSMTIFVFGILISDRTKGFIFPDLLRIGNRLQSRYKIAVLQEEPFLGVDGTGYVPDLLRLVAQWYASTSTDSDSFLYDIHPVDTWDHLLRMASATHLVSFGLIVPSLTKTEGNWKALTYSHSAVHTGLQLMGATKRKTKTSTTPRGSNATTTRQAATTTTTSLPIHSPGGAQFGFGGLDKKSSVFVALNGSPEAYVVQRYYSGSYGHKVKTVKNNDEALGYILRHPNSYLVKDSAVSDRMEEQFGSELGVVCRGRAVNIVPRSVLCHGFFGRDVVVINFLNDALRKLRSREKDQMKALNRRYFAHRRTCLH